MLFGVIKYLPLRNFVTFNNLSLFHLITDSSSLFQESSFGLVALIPIFQNYSGCCPNFHWKLYLLQIESKDFSVATSLPLKERLPLESWIRCWRLWIQSCNFVFPGTIFNQLLITMQNEQFLNLDISYKR